MITIRATRLLRAMKDFEEAKTAAGKIAALRDLLAVHGTSRVYLRPVSKMIIALRAEVAGKDEELLRRLDRCDALLAFRMEQERDRLERKHERDAKKQKTTPAVTPAPIPRSDLPW